MRKLTPNQVQVKTYVETYQEHCGELPSIAEMARDIGTRYTNAVATVNALKKKGIDLGLGRAKK